MECSAQHKQHNKNASLGKLLLPFSRGTCCREGAKLWTELQPPAQELQSSVRCIQQLPLLAMCVHCNEKTPVNMEKKRTFNCGHLKYVVSGFNTCGLNYRTIKLLLIVGSYPSNILSTRAVCVLRMKLCFCHSCYHYQNRFPQTHGGMFKY